MSKRHDLRIRTARLELIAATLELTDLELRGVGNLIGELNCDPPEDWPPPLNDENSQRWFLGMLEREPAAAGWGLWYIVRDEPGAPRVLIGNGGFKGRPAEGSCEIGYSLLPAHQRRGYATETARALVNWAFEHPEVHRVLAETLPELTSSIRVMEKCGMRFVGDGVAEEGQRTVRYQIARAESVSNRGDGGAG